MFELAIAARGVDKLVISEELHRIANRLVLGEARSGEIQDDLVCVSWQIVGEIGQRLV